MSGTFRRSRARGRSSVNIRILAIDQGANACGLAFLEGDHVLAVDVIKPKSGLPWAERMDYIAGELTHWFCSTPERTPDVVAIESVVVWKNVRVTMAMSETRGYLKRVVRELFPRARLMDINPSETKGAVGAGVRRKASKDRTVRVVEAMTGRRDLTEDQADAVAIAWAARTKLQTEKWERDAVSVEQMALR